MYLGRRIGDLVSVEGDIGACVLEVAEALGACGFLWYRAFEHMQQSLCTHLSSYCLLEHE